MSRTTVLRHADCALRPLRLEDRDRLLEWRNQDHVRHAMYTHRLITADEHARWLDRALADPSGRYLIFELEGRPTGYVCFTRIDPQTRQCHWAFYKGEPDAPAGTGAAMEFLALDHAFDDIGMETLCCEVLAFNPGVLRLHDRFGFQQQGVLTGHYHRDGQAHDVILLARHAQGWRADRQALAARVFASDAVIARAG